MDDDCRRRHPPPLPLGADCGGDEDRISCLPDELLQGILLCLGSALAAARTSVLSRRWRRVWTYLPELFLSDNEDLALSFPDTVDAALAAYAAPTLEHLSISMPGHIHGPGVPARRVSPWLRFASQRLAGRFFLHVSVDMIAFLDLATMVDGEEAEELELPACGSATAITLSLQGSWRLRLAGVFAALTELEIHLVRMEGRDISALVQTQCPLLKKLNLLVTLVAVSDVSIHSDLLQSLHYFVRNTRRLEVVAPILEELSLWCYETEEVLISAPKLAKVAWDGDAYDPRRHQFANVRNRLCLLETRLEPRITPVMKQFNEVDELSLEIFISQEIAGYECFLNETNKLSKSV
ncbi:hypothetical protein QOZ80_9AG0684190 [Eleusine coracana subsp. coracana]|nr:hypothetical protein QOZ80_9AG0684190 [Eleusine coracana subsp. coracana]